MTAPFSTNPTLALVCENLAPPAPPPPWPPQLPLVAILRGLQTQRARDVAATLFDAGFRALEVPLNRPGALAAIDAIARHAPLDAWIGAGTVIEAAQVDAVADVGGRLIVSPHLDEAIVARAHARMMRCAPGVFTATEAFAAWRVGADALKFFPAEALLPTSLQALTTILPPDLPVWPVGGILPSSMAAWRRAGATGFGLGGALFKPEFSLDEIRARARDFVQAWQAANGY